jgi:histidinol-phosphatase
VTDLERELQLAIELTDLADAFTLPRFVAQDFALGWKDDRTEVTEADRGCETLLAEHVAKVRPEHGFFGEEHGLQGSRDSPWRWIVDPIDGTSGFVRGIPVWGSLVALLHGDDPVVAAISAPALGRRWWATRGGGAFAQAGHMAAQIRVSEVTELTDAQVSVTFSAGWEALGLTGELVALLQNARRARGFGDFWQHCLVAEGALDVAVDAVGLRLYDVVAPRLIVEEAGGRFTDRFGSSEPADHAISSNGRLHDAVLSRLGRDPGVGIR